MDNRNFTSGLRAEADRLKTLQKQDAELLAERQKQKAANRQARERQQEHEAAQSELRRQTGSALQHHIRQRLHHEYSIQQFSDSVSVDLSGRPGTVLNFQIDTQQCASFARTDLKNIQDMKIPVHVVRYGDGYPEVGDLMTHLHAQHIEIQISNRPAKVLELPDVAALDDFLGRLSYHMDPHLDEMKKVVAVRQSKTNIIVLFILFVCIIVMITIFGL
ncbi:hypothetical protein ACOI1H_22985 [Loktanella sp. DJP18]|uniref:hypothetical protein n=1 Tax=Loktanella sp. DJP18 TaxID=3409788 RepID=UPI003BB64171